MADEHQTQADDAPDLTDDMATGDRWVALYGETPNIHAMYGQVGDTITDLLAWLSKSEVPESELIGVLRAKDVPALLRARQVR